MRRYHFVPALRGFGCTGSNWAEIGHSMMKRHTKVWLSVVAVEDIADFIVQENNYLSFDKHTHPDSHFVPSRAAKHRVLKKFSRKNPMQKYKNRGLATQECNLPEEVSLDEEDENEADISSQ